MPNHLPRHIREVSLGWNRPVIEDGIMLRCEDDLCDGTFFVDENHAREWLGQPFVTEEEYSIDLVKVKKTKCCHKVISAECVESLSIGEYLKRIEGVK